MILLTSTSDLLRVITSAAVTVDVHASYVDFVSPSTITPQRTNTAITTATTTTVVASPAASTYRTVKALLIRNTHATSQVDTTIVHTDGTTAVNIFKVTLLAGEVLYYDESNGFRKGKADVTTAYKVLGESLPSAATATTLYTVPASTSASCSTISICNQGASTTYRIAIRPAGAALTASQYLVYDAAVNSNDTIILSFNGGLALATTDVVTVYAGTANVSFHVYGTEFT